MPGANYNFARGQLGIHIIHKVRGRYSSTYFSSSTLVQYYIYILVQIHSSQITVILLKIKACNRPQQKPQQVRNYQEYYCFYHSFFLTLTICLPSSVSFFTYAVSHQQIIRGHLLPAISHYLSSHCCILCCLVSLQSLLLQSITFPSITVHF